MIKHPDFPNLMCDMEIYVDNHAGTMIHKVNNYVTGLRKLIMEKAGISADDFYMKTFEKAVIDDSAYFGDLLEGSIKNIAKDIREAHKEDWDTGDSESISDKYIASMKELLDQAKKPDTSIVNNEVPASENDDDDKLVEVDKNAIMFVGKRLDMNFTKLTPEEMRTFLQLVSKASRNQLFKQPSKGRGKKK